MKKFRGISAKITLLVVSVMLVSMLSITTVGYFVNFRQIDTAAGEELIGCASITSGLVVPDEVKALVAGDQSNLGKIEKNLEWIIDHKPIFKNASILSLDGKILALDSRLRKEGFQEGGSFYLDADAINMIKEMKHPAYSDIYTFGKYERKTGYAPIFADHDPDKEIIALMAIDFDSSIIKERTLDMLWFTLQIGGIFPLLAAALAYFYVRKTVKPLQQLKEKAEYVAAGDLTVSMLEVNREDEIGELSRSFNKMFANLHTLITQVNDAAKLVSTSSRELSEGTDQVALATEHISRAMHDMSEGARIQSQTAEQGTSKMGEMLVGIERIAETSAEVSFSAKHSAHAAETGVERINQVIQHIQIIDKTVRESEKAILQLTDHSKEIEKILDIIAAITSQTNLLSLNAAIESARAGEHGKGFSVVAGEVRKLAYQSEESAHQISVLVQKMEEFIQKAGVSMAKVSMQVEEGGQLVNGAGRAFQEILQMVKQVSSDIHKVTHTSGEIASASKEAASLVEDTLQIAKESAQLSQNVVATTEQQLASTQEIAASTESLHRTAEHLYGLVRHFKI